MKRKAKGVSEVLEKDPDGLKVLEKCVLYQIHQPDHEVKKG